MSASLFSEFGPSDKNTWKKQAEKELGKAIKKLNHWNITPELPLEAYYTLPEVDTERMTDLQNCQKKTPGWLNTPRIQFDRPLQTNEEIRSSLEAGADAIMLVSDEPELIPAALSRTLHTIRLSDTPIYFASKINQENIFDEISRGTGYHLKGGIANDPLANWMRLGTDFQPAVQQVSAVVKKTRLMPEFRPLMVESHVFHNAGANPVQELAFVLASAVYYLDKLTDEGIPPADIFSALFYSVSVGTGYLTEIAKLRALRFLHQKIARAYQITNASACAFIQAQTSSFYDARYSTHLNIVRSTSEAMSAVIGGCNALTVQPYDHLLQENNALGERVARNIPSLLSHESYLDRVSDPAAGSYLLEMMSLKLADAAWDLFLKTEEKGGLASCFQQGFIQNEIEHSWQEKVEALRKEKVMVGVNKFREEAEMTPGSESAARPAPASGVENLRCLPVRNLADSWTL